MKNQMKKLKGRKEKMNMRALEKQQNRRNNTYSTGRNNCCFNHIGNDKY